MQVDVVNSLKQGNEALKKMNEILKLEDIEKLMDDTREAAEYQNVRDDFHFYRSIQIVSVAGSSRKCRIYWLAG